MGGLTRAGYARAMPVPVLHPSLASALAAGGIDPEHFDVGFPADPEGPRPPRSEVFLIGGGEQFAAWQVPTLASLFRGNGIPPEMTDYPPEYVPVFAFIEQRVLTIAGIGRQPTDAEMEDIYANLRRRPDGRSLGATHDGVWQIAALTLGSYPLSAAEFDAIFGRLAKSARSWKTGPTTRNYLAGIEKMFRRQG